MDDDHGDITNVECEYGEINVVELRFNWCEIVLTNITPVSTKMKLVELWNWSNGEKSLPKHFWWIL